MQNRYFSDGCYHVNAFFCLSRRFGSTEAPCERWIGHLKYLFDVVQGPTTSTLLQRLRARAHGVRGDGADGNFIRRLASMLHTQGPAGVAGSTQMSRALAHFGKQAKDRVERDGPWLGLPVHEGVLAKRGAKEWESSAKQARLIHEPVELEAADKSLLAEQRKQPRAHLPLWAATTRQWQQERKQRPADSRKNPRVEAILWQGAAQARRERVAACKATAKPEASGPSQKKRMAASSSSSSSSSRGCGSSSESSASSPASEQASRVGAGGVRLTD